MREQEFYNWMAAYTDLADSTKNTYIHWVNVVEENLGNVDNVHLTEFDNYLERILSSFSELEKHTRESYYSAVNAYRKYREWHENSASESA